MTSQLLAGMGKPIVAAGGSDPLYTNLVAFWKLDEASGQRNDSVGSNHLTDNNTVLSTTGLVYATVGDFETDNNEYLSIADNAALSLTDSDWAIACWVNLESKGATRQLVSKFTAAGNLRSYSLRYLSSVDRFRLTVSALGTNTLGNVDAGVLGIPATATWYFVVAWHDATNNLIGINVNANASSDTAAHSTGVFDSTAIFYIGQDGALTAGVGMDGLIGPVMIWNNYIPDSADRTYLYNAGAGRTLAELAAL